MTKMLLLIFKLSVLLFLAPQSGSPDCPPVCHQEAAEKPAPKAQEAAGGIEVDFPLVQTIVLDL